MTKTQSTYDDWHLKNYDTGSDQHLNLAQWHIDALKLSPPLIGQHVLEVGCGVGDFGFSIEPDAESVTCLDFSLTAIQIAKQRASDRGSKINFMQGDACGLPFDDNTFDLVFSCECLEHVPEPRKAIKEMARVLKPGGALVLTTENYSNVLGLFYLNCFLRGKPFNSGHHIQPIENFFVFPMIFGMFKQAGLKMQYTLAAHHIFLMLPGCHPHRFVIERFTNAIPRMLFKFLGRHWTFMAVKPL